MVIVYEWKYERDGAIRAVQVLIIIVRVAILQTL